ncbi:MAG: hypothetical protein ACRD35_00505 [Candidatus Acidiferrales bacterium]
MAEFLGHASGIIARDLAELREKLGPGAETLAEAFRHGWRKGRCEETHAKSEPDSSPPASESA